MLHRDIKPSNVLVTADGMPMLLDFNLARESVVEDESSGGEPTLGGTIDYMPREQLKALAEGTSEQVDCRADIYSLGVVLFEALTGKLPFSSPRRGGSMVDLLHRAADQRLRPLLPLRDRHPEIPAAFETIIRRCLEPEPEDRYQFASQLAEDLQAVADDLPLPHTGEPWPGRAAAWLRRRRKRIATAATILFVASALLAGGLGLRIEQSNLLRQGTVEFEMGQDALDRRDFSAAKAHFDTAKNLASRSKQTPWSYLAGLQDFRQVTGRLKSKIEEPKPAYTSEDLQGLAKEKSKVAERTGQWQQRADDLFKAADDLRFQLLLDEGSELTKATIELQEVLGQFFVLENPDWTKIDHMMTLLDDNRRERIVSDVNELLFLWMAAIDESAGDSPPVSAKPGSAVSENPIERALVVCRKVLVWVEPKAPWRALEARLRASGTAGTRPAVKQDERAGSSGYDEPRDANLVDSALECFQWGVLAYRAGRLSRAIDWLERASRLEGGNNYWYQFLLGYLEDKAGQTDDAFRNYCIACSLREESPWVRFSRARIYRVRGKFDWAREDIGKALAKLQGRPEATRVRFELAYLYQQVGDFPRARAQCDLVIKDDDSGMYARAARLNLANMDAESGAIEKARKQYDALILSDLTDTVARKSRALLELRLGQAERAYIDLTALLDAKDGLKNRHEMLAARALALLLLGRGAEAVTDATEAQRDKPSPAHERLRQRALLAARLPESLQLDRPEDVLLLPLGGRRLSADLDSAVAALEKTIHARPETMLRGSLNQAVLLAALGRRGEALEAAARALRASPQSPRAYLIRARVNYFSGNLARAAEDVERGLLVQPNDPGLLELRGNLQAASGELKAAIESYNQAAHWGAFDRIHVYKAAALGALGRDVDALREWTLALRRDPELPQAYLGQARLAIRLKIWDLALADLELASAWAQSDPPTELAIAAAYLQCLPSEPDRFPRWLAMAGRTLRDFHATLFR